MAFVHEDSLNVLKMTHYLGVTRSLTREILVSDMDENDYRVLYAALEDAGITASFGQLLENDSYGQHLILVDAEISNYNKSKNAASIVQSFRHVLDGPYQDLENGVTIVGATGGPIYGSMSTSLQQDKANTYPTYDEDNEITAFNNITVEHTYPANDPNFPGETSVQGGEIDIFIPAATYNVSGWITTDQPWTKERKILNGINSDVFLGRPAKTWLCSDVRWRFIGKFEQFSRYEFHVEWQYNPDEWRPPCVFIDPNTNRPPTGLVEGTGKKRIDYYKLVDFNDEFARFEDVGLW